MAGKDLGYAGPALAASPPARVRRVPLWRELAFLRLPAAWLTVIVKTFPATFAQPARWRVPLGRGPARLPWG